jgi:hypothetical protein
VEGRVCGGDCSSRPVTSGFEGGKSAAGRAGVARPGEFSTGTQATQAPMHLVAHSYAGIAPARGYRDHVREPTRCHSRCCGPRLAAGNGSKMTPGGQGGKSAAGRAGVARPGEFSTGTQAPMHLVCNAGHPQVRRHCVDLPQQASRRKQLNFRNGSNDQRLLGCGGAASPHPPRDPPLSPRSLLLGLFAPASTNANPGGPHEPGEAAATGAPPPGPAPREGGLQGLGMLPTACHPADRRALPAEHECERAWGSASSDTPRL